MRRSDDILDDDIDRAEPWRVDDRDATRKWVLASDNLMQERAAEMS